MKKHIAYLKYVLLHKWFVFKARKLTGCSLWRALVHDLSKFSLSEWLPYVNTFYDENGNGHYKPSVDFDYAWNNHQKYNKHHWQYWVLMNDSGKTTLLQIPDKYIKELVADWFGASMAITGKNDVKNWYNKNKDKMTIHTESREKIERIIENCGPC